MEDLKVGSRIWFFDQGRRVYAPAPPGQIWPNRGPIYREHWREVKITGENRRSWIIGTWGKCPKKGPHRGWAFSAAEVDADCWMSENRYAIVRLLDRCYDPAKLRQVGEILGYKQEASE